MSDERKEENDKFQKAYDKLLTNVSALAVRRQSHIPVQHNDVSKLQDILDEDMPDLPEQQSITEENTSAGSIDIQFPIPKSEVILVVTMESIVNDYNVV